MKKELIEMLLKARKELEFWNSPLVKEIDLLINKHTGKCKKTKK